MIFSRQQIKEKYLTNRAIEGAIFKKPCSDELEMIVVIPSYSEEHILQTLKSLTLCEVPDCEIEVLVLLNGCEEERTTLSSLYASDIEKIKTFAINSPEWITFLVAERYMHGKHAGVGMARKILMDEAVRRFCSIGKDGLIINLDADCIVHPDYFCSVKNHFLEHSDANAASIGFKHRNLHNRIIDYEIHMRMMRLGLERASSPYAFHAVGSAMAVRDLDYCKQGGMNKRKAGEDFYFLHKFSELSQLSELKHLLVFPDSRESNRVPFGTGRAMLNSKEGMAIETYSTEIYRHLKELMDFFRHQLDEKLDCLSSQNKAFLKSWDFERKLVEIQNNVSSDEALIKRMMRKFNAFQTMKYKHFMRDNYFSSLEVIEAAEDFFKWNSWEFSEKPIDILNTLTRVDLGIRG